MAATKKPTTPPKVEITQQILNTSTPDAAVSKLLNLKVAIPGSKLKSGKGDNLQQRLIQALRGLDGDPFVRTALSTFVLWCVGGSKGIVNDPFTVDADAKDPTLVAPRVRTLIQALEDHHAEKAGLARVDKRRQDALDYLQQAYERLSKMPNRTAINDAATSNFGKRGLLQWAGFLLFSADEARELFEGREVLEAMDLPAATAKLETKIETLSKQAFERGRVAVGLVAVAGAFLGLAASGTLTGFIAGGLLAAALVGLIIFLVFTLIVKEVKSIFFRVFPQMDQAAFDRRVKNECRTIFKNTGLTSPDEIKKFRLIDQFEAVVELQMSKEGLAFKRYDDRINNLVAEFIESPASATPSDDSGIGQALSGFLKWLWDL